MERYARVMHLPGRWPNPWSRWWATRRSRALDIALALGMAVGDGLLGWFAYQEFWLPRPVTTAGNVVLALALVARRRHPVALAVITTAVSTAMGSGGFSFLVVLYSLGAYASPRGLVITIAAAGYLLGLLIPGATAPRDVSALANASFGLGFTALPVVLGLYMGARKQLLASLQERAARLEREQHLLAERARAEERTRIAREMHDVVANRVSVIVVHAGALKAVAARDPRRAAETAAVIGDMGRQALEELRQVIGVLRQGEEALPQSSPAVSDIRGLVDQSGAAGLRVELDVTGEERPMPAAVGRTVYRLVQEALTNVHKHAGDADTCVRLDLLPEAVEVEVRNQAPAAPARHNLPSGGNGLVGLRERVTALGGAFEAGPTGDGGYRLHARVPLPAS
ncbi:histidine kinase [Actinomadura kijaniata]|uniref:histidine kinase n=1 Tax=Actinomadura namibiensis TaxID=182080 RepID=A0A7W3QP79_ACTNM|nr:histidine kinase [Actinomadura namibiensis]MBA8953848.1 signal transduction histidine kinase [Actinomadura namibiensis]